jgi:hypothetical protein
MAALRQKGLSMRRALLLVALGLVINGCTEDDDLSATDARRDQGAETADVVRPEGGSPDADAGAVDAPPDVVADNRDVSAETSDTPVDQPVDQADMGTDGPAPADSPPDTTDADTAPAPDMVDMTGAQHDLPAEPTISPACGGGAMLADICDGYCGAITAVCTGANAQFATMQACLTACTLPTWSCGEPGDMTGNTVFCRLGHAALASGDPAANCAKAGPQSTTCQ